MSHYRPPAVRKPPSRAWYVVGSGLLVLAGGVGVALFVLALGPFLATDARVPVDGEPHRVEVPTDGERMIWTSEFLIAPDCTVTDLADGTEIDLRPVTGDFRRSTGSAGGEIGAWRFSPGSGAVEVRCDGVDSTPPASIAIGPAPHLGVFVGGIFAMITVPLALGLLGLVTLVVTAVLRARRT